MSHPVPTAPDSSEDEFLQGAFPTPDSGVVEGVDRRTVLKGAGAAAALTALGACFRQPPREMLPYSERPEQVRPGLPLHFATCASLGGYAVGLLVESREGHPQKIEGNPQHPWSLGATGPIEQAELLQLYDPGRQRAYVKEGQPISRQEALEALQALGRDAEKDGGARLRILAEPDGSPLLQSLKERVLERFPRARVVHWTSLSEHASTEGSALAFGTPLTAVPDFRDAEVILSLDADVLGMFPGSLRHSRELTARRVPEKTPLNRLYVVETALTVTGMFADHRLALAPSRIEAFAMALLHALAEAGAPAEWGQWVTGLPRPDLDEPRWRFTRAVARDLLRTQNRSVVVCGPRQPSWMHAVAHAVNHALGNVGRTVRLHAPVLPVADSGPGALRGLVEEMGRGEVDALVITAWNPAYTAPGDLDLAAMLPKVPQTVYATLRPDQTSAASRLALPRAHFLEAWGDGRSPDGSVGFTQPLILPLFEGLTEAEILALLAGAPGKDGWELLRTHGRLRAEDAQFREWLRLGLVPDSAFDAQEVPPRWDEIGAALQRWRPREGPSLEVSFAADYSVHDGRYGDNAWLQELPDPVTKIVWDNAAYLSARTAARLGVESGDMVRLTLRGRSIDAPIWIMPGHAEDAVTLPLGYGLPGGVGFNASPLRSSDALWSASGLELERTGRKHLLVQTQQAAEQKGRPLALTRSIHEWSPEDQELKALHSPDASLYAPWKDAYENAPHKWGMAIDLSRCTGCSACVLACQSENNIPTVGKKEVANHREMHWLRVDRYFREEADTDAPAAITQPLMCVHCESAPCEYVCPVNATVHSDEGLNEMIYNRCIGTRYCSNNCPYKVRRFNFFDYQRHVDPLETLYKNPDVTVRARGVMEKCTYCVQRIERARIHARVQNEPIRTDELQTACQQVCPTEAIVFGDLHD
ncbi:MAG: 4Fe-4S dicluster domain-containing protein, partial [Myxococcaceae bacterium]